MGLGLKEFIIEVVLNDVGRTYIWFYWFKRWWIHSCLSGCGMDGSTRASVDVESALKKSQSIWLNKWVLQLSPERMICIRQVDSLNVMLSQVDSLNVTLSQVDSLNVTESSRLTKCHVLSSRLTKCHVESSRLTKCHVESSWLTKCHVESSRLTKCHVESSSPSLKKIEKW